MNTVTLHMCVPGHFIRVQLFETPWTIALQSLSMGFSRQEYWSGLPCPPPGDLLDPGTEPVSPTLAGGFFTCSTIWEAQLYDLVHVKCQEWANQR